MRAMEDTEKRRTELMTRFYEAVCSAMARRRCLSIKLVDPLKKEVALVIEPYYVNLTWDLDFYMIAKRRKGIPLYGERRGWNVIFFSEVKIYYLLEDTFQIDQGFQDFMMEFGHTFARPSEYENSVCALPLSPWGDRRIV